MRLDFCGLPLDSLSINETVEAVAGLVKVGGAHQHVVLNASKVVQAHDDPDLARIIHGCALVSADGMSVVWAGRALGLDVPERVTGIDLFGHLLDRAEREGWPVYLLGGEAVVVERVVEVQRVIRPGLVVAGWRDGFWRADEEHAVVSAVARSGARLLFVALPSPSKEQFLHDYLPEMGDIVGVGVGGSFDIVAGVTRRAPGFLRRSGLEWAYRLAQEPRRMARRYLIGNPRFLLLLMRCWYRRWAGRTE